MGLFKKKEDSGNTKTSVNVNNANAMRELKSSYTPKSTTSTSKPINVNNANAMRELKSSYTPKQTNTKSINVNDANAMRSYKESKTQSSVSENRNKIANSANNGSLYNDNRLNKKDTNPYQQEIDAYDKQIKEIQQARDVKLSGEFEDTSFLGEYGKLSVKELDDLWSNVEKERKALSRINDTDHAINKQLKDSNKNGAYKESDIFDYTDGQVNIKDFTKELSYLNNEIDGIQKKIDGINQSQQLYGQNYGGKTQDVEQTSSLKKQLQELTNRRDELNRLQQYQNAYLGKVAFDDAVKNKDTETLSQLHTQFGSYNDNALERTGKAVAQIGVNLYATGLSVVDIARDFAGDVIADKLEETANFMHENGQIDDKRFNEFLENAKEISSFEADDPNNYSSEMRALANQLSYETMNGLNGVERFVAEGVTSTANFFTQFYLMGPTGSLVSMGLQSGTQKYFENLERGYDKKVALANAVATGLISYATEKIGMDNFVSILNGTAGKGAMAQLVNQIAQGKGNVSIIMNNVISQGLAEGLEEMAEGNADYFLDYYTARFFDGEPVEYSEGDLFYATLVGAFSGAITGGMGSVNTYNLTVQTREQYNQLRNDVNSLIQMRNEALTNNEDVTSLNKAIDIGTMALNNFEVKSPVSMAVEFPQDAVDTNLTQEGIVQETTDILQPNIDEAVNTTLAKEQIQQNVYDMAQQFMTYNNINEDAREFINLSPESRQSVIDNSNYATRLGVNVGFSLSVDGDGYFDPSTKTIMINPNSTRGEVSTLIHELTHFNESSDYYKTLSKLAEESYGENTQERVQEIKNLYKDFFKRNGNNKSASMVDDAYAQKEFTAIETQDQLGNEEYVKKLIRYNESLAYRIFDNIRSMTSSDVKTKLENTFAKAFRDAQNIQTNSELQPQFSFTTRELNEKQINNIKDISTNAIEDGKLKTFEQQLDEYSKAEYNRKNRLVISPTTDFLSWTNLEDRILTVSEKVLNKILALKHSDQNLYDVLKNIDNELVNNTVIAFDGVGKNEGKKAVIIQTTTNETGEPILIALKGRNIGYNEVEVNDVVTIHKRNSIKDTLSKAKVFYLNEKSMQWLHDLGLQLPSDAIIHTSNDIIPNEEGNVNTQSQYREDGSRKDLRAIHNLSLNELEKSLDLGGFAMPSIAVTKDSINHSGYGDVSIVFDKDTIDPSIKENEVFGGDAYTSRFPNLEYKVSSPDEMFRLYDIEKEYGLRSLGVKYDSGNLEELFNNSDSLEDAKGRLSRMDATKLLFMDSIGDLEKHKDHVKEYIDSGLMNALIKVQQEQYDAFVDNLVNNMVEQSGLRNNKDIYTPSGNRRSFDQTHDEYNLQNALKIMLDASRGNSRNVETGFGSTGINGMIASQTQQFKSIDDIIKNEDRLSDLANNEYAEIRQQLSESINNEIYKFVTETGISDGLGVYETYQVGDALAMEMLNAKSDKQALKIASEYYTGKATDEQILDFYHAIQEYKEPLRNMPTRYFEAKPRRIVAPSEWKQAYVPSTASSELIQRLEDLGVEVIEYSDDYDLSRKDAMNVFAQKHQFSTGLTNQDQNNNVKKESTDDFKLLQNESERIANSTSWGDKSRVADAKLQQRLSQVFRMELESRDYSPSNADGLLKDTGDYKIYKDVDGQTFHDIFSVARTYLNKGELVDLHPVDTTEHDGWTETGYNDTRNFLSDDGLSGFAITKDGDLISVFNLSDKGGFLRSIAPFVRENVKTLDCYVLPNSVSKTNLQDIYNKAFGFETDHIEDYDVETYGDENGIAERYNNPQIAYMYNPNYSGDTQSQGTDTQESVQEDGKRQQRFPENLEKSQVLNEEQKESLRERVANNEFTYTGLNNQEEVNKARDSMLNAGVDGYFKEYMNNNSPSAKTVVQGEVLLTELAKNNDPRWEQVASKLADDATVAGQFLQAYAIMQRLTPEGQLVAIRRNLNRMQRDVDNRFGNKGPQLNLNENLVNDLKNAKTIEEAMEVREKIYEDLENQIPKTVRDVINSWRYLSMLGNPRTHIRNIVGNAIFAPTIDIKNTIGSVLEKVAGNKLEYKTKAVLNPLSSADNQLLRLGNEAYEKYRGAMEQGQKYETKSFSENTKLGRILNKLSDFNSQALDKEDFFFSKRRYASSYAQFLKANNLTADTLTDEMAKRANDYALLEAQKATYRDANSVAEWLNKLSTSDKKGMRMASYVKDAIMPFTKTPMNIVKRGVQYSPVGLLKTITYDSKQLADGKINANQYIDNMASGLTGTGIALIGALLRSMGLFRTKDDDKDRKQYFDKEKGEQDYAIDLSPLGINGTYTIDWASPVIMPFAIGAELFDVFKDFEGVENFEGVINAVADVSAKIMDPIMETSMLSSLQDALKSYSTSGGAWLGDMVWSMTSSYIQQMVPTIGGQIARTIDDTRRTTSPNNGKIDKLIRQIFNKIPWLSQLNQPYINRQGLEEKTEDMGKGWLGRAVLNMASPGYYSSKDIDDYDEELYRLHESTGSYDAFPSSTSKQLEFEGEKYQFTPEQYTQWHQTRWQTETEYVNQFIDSQAYQNLTDEERVDTIKDIRSYAQKVAKKEFLESQGYEYTDDKELAESDDKYVYDKQLSGAQGAVDNDIELYSYFDYLNNAGSKQAEKVKYLEESGLSQKQKEYLWSLNDYKKSYEDVYKKVFGGEGSSSSKKKSSSKSSKKVSSSKSTKKKKAKKVSISGTNSSGITQRGKVSSNLPQRMVSNPINTTKIADTFLKAYSSSMNKTRKASTGGSSTVVCPKCGNKVSSASGRCPICGAKL